MSEGGDDAAWPEVEELVESAGPFTANAWLGGEAPAEGRFSEDLVEWATGEMPRPFADRMYDDDLPDFTRWDDPRVGWGLVLPLDPSGGLAEQAVPQGPPSLVRLWEARGRPPVYRFIPGDGGKPDYLRRYRFDAAGQPRHQDLSLSLSPKGGAVNEVPFYLLLYGTPAELPWSLQLTLNGTRAVGRLDLTEEEGLGRYVDALLDDWGGGGATIAGALAWAVDHQGGARDITDILRRFLVAPLVEKLDGDTTVTRRNWLVRDGATEAALREALAEAKPGVIVTSSHGAILADRPPAERRANLGVLVDQAWKPLQVDALLKAWQPDGALWYAHACCSAGTDAGRRFLGALDPHSSAAEAVRAAGELGEASAPLPRRLLGAERPLRAFVGHVGPTFSWTLREKRTRQSLTAPLLAALYHHLYQRRRYPVGFAFRPCYEPIGALYSEHHNALALHRKEPWKSLTAVVDRKLMAEDVKSLVLLGDPTALRPPG